MIKFLVFAAFLTAVSSLPTDSSGIPNLLELGDDSPICREETAKFKSCFSYGEESNAVAESLALGRDRETILNISVALKDGLKCMGEVKCNKLVFLKFGAESAVFGIEKIFTEGYECTSQINFKSDLFGCVISEVPMEDINTGYVSAIGTQARPIARCFAKIPKCGDVPRKAFLQGALAMADFLAETFKLLEDAQNHSFKALNSFNKKFNPSDYDNVEL